MLIRIVKISHIRIQTMACCGGNTFCKTEAPIQFRAPFMFLTFGGVSKWSLAIKK